MVTFDFCAIMEKGDIMKRINNIDLLYVLIVGFIASTIAGVFDGSINYFLSETIGFSFHLIFLVVVYFVAKNIRRQYVEGDIIYQVLAIIFVFYAYLLSMAIGSILQVGIDVAVPVLKSVFNLEFIFVYFNPLNLIKYGFQFVIEMLFLLVSGFIAYRETA